MDCGNYISAIHHPSSCARRDLAVMIVHRVFLTELFAFEDAVEVTVGDASAAPICFSTVFSTVFSVCIRHVLSNSSRYLHSEQDALRQFWQTGFVSSHCEPVHLLLVMYDPLITSDLAYACLCMLCNGIGRGSPYPDLLCSTSVATPAG